MNFLHDMDWVLPLRGDAATAIANGFTWLGYSTFFLIAMPLIYWLWDRAVAMRLVALVVLTAVTNSLLKDLSLDPRPDPRYWLDQRVAGSYGRPSGHAQIAAAMWPWIAYELKRPWFWGVALFIAAGVCLSRLYLGVHDLDDVLTGIGLGIASILLLFWFLSPAFGFARKAPVAVHLALIVALGVLLSLVWPSGGEGAQGVTTVLALLSGWVLGADVDRRLAPRPPVLPVWWLRVIMAVGGVVALFILRMALDGAAEAAGVKGIASGHVTGALIGFYMTCGAPFLFRALGLAR